MEQVAVLGGLWSGIERRGTALAEGKPFVDAPIQVRLSTYAEHHHPGDGACLVTTGE